MTTIEQTTRKDGWHSKSADDVAAELGVDPDEHHAADRRRAQLHRRADPDGHLRSRAGDVQRSDGLQPGAEAARASVEALAQLQVPQARVRRAGAVEEVESPELVPGDIVLFEAGDVVPADWRVVTSATLELQEAALTGESAPAAKDGTSVLDADTAFGDRTNLVCQNTQVTRGTATVLVTATGSSTEMGRIAHMVTSTQRQRSPLQKELDGMTKIFGSDAWLVVVVIAIVGILRGQTFDTVALLCISTAIASIPVGLPTFVQAMLSSGAQRLAEHKAVVKSLADVETLGGTTVINSDKTGTLTLNQMTATTMLAGREWFDVEGGGYRKSGAR